MEYKELEKDLFYTNKIREEDGELLPCSICSNIAPASFMDKGHYYNVEGVYNSYNDFIFDKPQILMCEFCGSSYGSTPLAYEFCKLELSHIYKDISRVYDRQRTINEKLDFIIKSLCSGNTLKQFDSVGFRDNYAWFNKEEK